TGSADKPNGRHDQGHHERGHHDPEHRDNRAHLAEAARAGAETEGKREQLVLARTAATEEALQREIARGYDIAFVGIDKPIVETTQRFEERLQALLTRFDGPVAIAINGVGAAGPADVPLDILLPTGGTH